MDRTDAAPGNGKSGLDTGELLSCLMAGIAEFVFIHNLTGKIREVNSAAVKGLGFTVQELLSSDMTAVLASPPPLRVKQAWKNLDTGHPFSAEGIVRRKDGTSFPALLSFFPLVRGEEPAVLTIARDITDLKAAGEGLSRGSFKDPLTGLYNRAFFEEELKRLDCDRQLPLSIIMGDLNGLKMANDAFGHQVGDALLKAAAKVLRKICRSSDLLFRWGGDEFVILLPHTREEDAASIVNRIEDAFRKIQVKDMPVPPSMSLGYSAKLHRWQDFANVFRDAEGDMYDKKISESRKIRETILGSIFSSLAESTPETVEHNLSVRRLCRMLGRRLGLERLDLEKLDLAAYLHDIGKASIPPRILSKTGPLTEEEWEDVKRHAEAGYKVASSATPDVASVADEILSHHERWDGTGYPSGLPGEDIPLLSRIIAVADAFDVMTRGTPYRPARSRDDALREVKEQAGRQFDPKIADFLLENRGKTDEETAEQLPPVRDFTVE
ncbi:PAS domain S-box-containing protein/diguanylate cyclase (GGDEF)-like protein/putative nucleotidyltransferase with HDIG domain [Aminivibrio pyruvatiphilus]|jgi:diguanylate cyclase (GGDEF)-like protein/PAS domain S-box-containing protein/putative nucleotidyltransferase with HDIG domain|uniref:PAS domain S-box-containing protein/diguanylate cyclase (GGDEF)-like protein/putative nucleotidyltransferase with HDIG domain n=1 Tax=Aminivibrio pyruvatiphilus TaxID=1005740 RepID=A0A4R8MBF5_9BACT|nr:HD domain-containing phosphohydrolase [Aminivibrio pyruvatiphilus]TDY61592.1 PAS domain S-box-containing protein/diguanylate cyclase (GGDEF)-like protein/putative nucleotidyltransferase with HDIG domain [Aminivibrio pyruvatiphilus]